MSQALQRVIVRMLHDPAFATAVFAGSSLSELTPTERELLRRTDPRAYTTDPYRRSRVLQSLIEEFPCAVALASDGGRALGRVDAFMSSSAFHTAIQERRSLALVFGSWLEPQAEGVAALERAVAAGRRWRRRRGAGLALATGAEPVAVPSGTLARWRYIQDRLGPEPLEALVQGSATPGSPPALEADLEYWVVVRNTDGSTGLVGSAEGTHALLQDTREPQPARALTRTVEGQGVDPETAAKVLTELVVDGVLSPA